MIERPNQPPGTLERKVELQQTVHYAIQVLVEEACLLGWTQAEFLTSISDTAIARLSLLDEDEAISPPAEGDLSRTIYPTD
ncbi:hypothetical protein IB279_33030 [Ensifer sp. ENS06]|uniref:hypothetical protein n=1 Tax=unclassified Ensifer TaxID=2633371 RepID=UPI000DDCAA8C|nr:MULTISPECIES: hypothetical protein [unclassified Ensifer]MBD9627781.1 hypothetical protein [Ensifer sp. ENS06]MCY1746208.1 hypothetical protein [Ensifer sp. SL37]